MIDGEDFPLDLSGKEPAILLNKMDDSVKLFFDEAAFIGDDSDCDNPQTFVVVGVDFGYGGIEPAPQPLDEAFDNFPLVLD